MSNREDKVSKAKRQRPRVPREDRLRAIRACKACQRSKLRCVEPASYTGQCARCQRKSLPCNYRSQDATAFTSTPESTRVLQSSLNNTCDGMRGASSYTPTVYRSTTAHVQDGTPTRQESVRLLEEHTLPPESLVGGGPGLSTDRLSGLLSRIRLAMFLGPSGATGGSEVASPSSRSSSARQTSSNSNSIQHVLRQLPPKAVADFLCSCAFELGTDSFFYMCQDDFKRKLGELYSDHASSLKDSHCFICLVLMTLALGSQFAHLRSSSARSSTNGTRQSPGLFFHNLASPLIPQVVVTCSVEAVQACFVLSVYLLPEHAYDQSYFYMGLALRIAIALNLHRRRTGHHRDIEISHRLWWSIYSLERTVSIKLGRPRAIAIKDVDTPLPQPLAFLDHTQDFNNIQHQIANANLVLIMDKYTQTTPFDPTKEYGKIDALERIQNELKQWRKSLPSCLQIQNLRPNTLGHRTVIHLHMNYHITSIFLTRVSLLFMVRQHLKRLFGKPDSQALDDNRVENFAGHCAEAARNVIELFESLQQSQSLGMFSFTDFQGCSTATVILLLDSMLHGSTTDSSHIEAGFSCLRYMALENRQAKIGVRFVEEFKSIADEVLVNARQTFGTRVVSEDHSTSIAAYEEWIYNLAPVMTVDEDTRDTFELTPSERRVPFAAPNISPTDPSLLESVEPSNSIYDLPGNLTRDDPNDPNFFHHQRDYCSMSLDNFDDSLLLGLTGLDTLDCFISTNVE